MLVRLFKYDIRGFTTSLKLNFSGALHEALIRHAIAPALGVIYKYKKLTTWLEAFRSLISKERFLLIVLDDARYDFFARAFFKYLDGSLIKVKAPPPHTYGWLPEIFSLPEFDRIRIFYASLGIKTHDIMIERFVPKNREIEVISIKPRKAKHLMTVLPDEVNETVYQVGLSGRDVIWYAQPHFPWVVDKELSLSIMKEAMLHDFVPPDLVRNALKRLNISRSRVIKAYYGNLLLVLKYVKKLIGYIKRLNIKYEEVVVTSDHGEMLGELGLYMHQDYDLPQLVIVPWLKLSL